MTWSDSKLYKSMQCRRDVCFSYHVSLLSIALLDPAELSKRQLSGNGGGQRQLVVATSSSLQFQTWKIQSHFSK